MRKLLLLTGGITVVVAVALLMNYPSLYGPGLSDEFTREKKERHKPLPQPTLNFSSESSTELLSRARSAVSAAVKGDQVSCTPCQNPELQVKAGCFVTLKNQGGLRGCIGRFSSDDPLWKTVYAVAILSATQDTRFAHHPITPEEVPRLEIEISVISPMRQITRPLEEITLGRDGVVIMDKGRSGTFLPQVAAETGWSLEEFLGHCARDKAGLAWDGWRSPTARVLGYTATIISEKDFAAVGHK